MLAADRFSWYFFGAGTFEDGLNLPDRLNVAGVNIIDETEELVRKYNTIGQDMKIKLQKLRPNNMNVVDANRTSTSDSTSDGTGRTLESTQEEQESGESDSGQRIEEHIGDVG